MEGREVGEAIGGPLQGWGGRPGPRMWGRACPQKEIAPYALPWGSWEYGADWSVSVL